MGLIFIKLFVQEGIIAKKINLRAREPAACFYVQHRGC